MYIIYNHNLRCTESEHDTLEQAQAHFAEQSHVREWMDGQYHNLETTYPLNHTVMVVDQDGNRQMCDEFYGQESK